MFTFDENILSDLHKDAYGSRPGGLFWEGWDLSTDEQKQIIWDNLIEALEASIDEEERQKIEALKEFHSQINLNIALGAGDRTTALRWMTQNETFYHEQDVEHWVWKQGILFTDEGRALVKELMDIVTFVEWEAA